MVFNNYDESLHAYMRGKLGPIGSEEALGLKAVIDDSIKYKIRDNDRINGKRRLIDGVGEPPNKRSRSIVMFCFYIYFLFLFCRVPGVFFCCVQSEYFLFCTCCMATVRPGGGPGHF